MADFTGENVSSAAPTFGDISINPVGQEFSAVPPIQVGGLPGGIEAVAYFQRVWDAGTAGYCYYEKFFIDPAPLASETSPNYTGAISAHAIISLR